MCLEDEEIRANNHNNTTNKIPLKIKSVGVFSENRILKGLVRETGVEPAHLAILAPKASASTNSATRAITIF